MNAVFSTKNDEIATVSLQRGKVNALNEPMVEELQNSLQELEKDENITSVILTGTGKFFSFGFDVPEFLNYSKSLYVGHSM
jgi:enoyl-CoA hydratase/carnithine racemase